MTAKGVEKALKFVDPHELGIGQRRDAVETDTARHDEALGDAAGAVFLLLELREGAVGGVATRGGHQGESEGEGHDFGGHPKCSVAKVSLALFTFLRIWRTVAVQVKGLGSSLRHSM